MKTPITLRSLKQHFTYSWWKYLLAVVASVALVSLLFDVTAPRTPDEKKVEFYVYGSTNNELLPPLLEKIHQTEMQDMEEISSVTLAPDDTYGPMQLMTYLYAGEGDLYLLSKEQFVSFASSGALYPLEDDQQLMDLFTASNISLQSGWRKEAETGKSHLYGIPQNKIPGLYHYALADNGFLCITINGGNIENTLRFLRILCRDMLREEAVAADDPSFTAAPSVP